MSDLKISDFKIGDYVEFEWNSIDGLIILKGHIYKFEREHIYISFNEGCHCSTNISNNKDNIFKDKYSIDIDIYTNKLIKHIKLEDKK